MTTSPPRKSNSLAFVFQVGACVLGTLLSLYLLAQHTRLRSGIQEGSSFCSWGRFADCDAVNAGPFSEFLGIPIAGIGAAYYFALLLVSLMSATHRRESIRMQRWLAWMTVPGLVIDLFLFSIQAAVLHNFCVLCCATYLFTFIVFYSSALLQSGRRVGPIAAVKNALVVPDLSEPIEAPLPSLLMMLLAFVSFSAFVGILPAAIRLDSFSFVQSAMEQFFSQWKERPVKAISFKPTDATYGNPNAKVKIFEFSDFECPHCRKAAFTVHTSLKTLGNRVHFVFKNFPLDSACNEMVTYQLHPHACELARLAYCAQQKGKFWEFHDAIFLKWNNEDPVTKGQPLSDLLKGPLKPIFTEAEYQACLNDPASLQNAKDDIRLGSSLGIKGTPTIFINGKQVTIPLTLENLEKIVSLEEKL